jgi:hypothetical protein
MLFTDKLLISKISGNRRNNICVGIASGIIRSPPLSGNIYLGSVSFPIRRF